MRMLALGIDIGGSGVKGAIVDTETGRLVSPRVRIPTPQKPSIEKLLPVIFELLEELEWNNGPVGIGFPGVIHGSTIRTAVNLHASLIGINLAESIRERIDGAITVLNDADAAGVAEMRFGAGRGFTEDGTVLLLTIGTGIGTVLFSKGHLVPNMELGHIAFDGATAEQHLSERVRKEKGISWKRWGRTLNDFLLYIEFLLQTDLIILGGGGAKKIDKFEEYLKPKTPWKLAHAGNLAGIIGAATAAANMRPGHAAVPSTRS